MTDGRDPAVDAAFDELGAASLDEFVATRDRLARALKTAGHGDAAATVRSRRRPSMVAWSVNRAARDRRDLVEALYAAADDVRVAVERSDGDALRTAMRAQRARIAELTDVAVARAGEASPSPEAHREAIARTWEAAAGDVTLRDAVASGWLSTELQPGGTVSGTPAAGSGSASPPRSPAASKTTPTKRRKGSAPDASSGSGSPPPGASRRRLPRDELAVRRAEETVTTARQDLADAQAAASEAEKDVARATRAATRAHQERERAERRLARAEHALAERRSR